MLGRGAAGVVVAGRHRRLGRDVALKQLAPGLGSDAQATERFLAEARLLASLDHPRCCAHTPAVGACLRRAACGWGRECGDWHGLGGGKVVVISRDVPETTTDVAAVGALGGASRSVLDTAHEAYVRMDAGGFITDLNPAAEALFGWSRAEAIGRVLGDTIIPERLRGQHLAGLERFLATGEGPVLGRRLQLAAIHRDGHEFPVEITISTTREASFVASLPTKAGGAVPTIVQEHVRRQRPASARAGAEPRESRWS